MLHIFQSLNVMHVNILHILQPYMSYNKTYGQLKNTPIHKLFRKVCPLTEANIISKEEKPWGEWTQGNF